MLDAILKSKFYTKCKAEMKMTKKRIEIIKRKRNAMQRFLKNDVADLLRTALESNAYGRVEQLYLDQKLSSCYEFVDQSCLLVLSNLSAMNKQRECPDECKEAISTLMFAAARFADLPELRELRSLFVERYGDYLEPYVNQEFVMNLKADPPSKECKLEMMQEIATECGIKWNSNALGQKLFKPSPVVKETNPYANVTNKESVKRHHQNATERNIQGTEKKINYKQTEVAKNDHTIKHGLPYKSREEVAKDEKHQIPTVGNRLPYKPRVEVKTQKEEKHGNGRLSPYWSSNSSSSSETITSPDDSASEDIPEERKFHAFKSTVPPYVKTESIKKSTSSDTTSITGRKEDVVGLKCKEDNLQSDKTDERKLYGLRSMGPPYIKPEMTKKPTNLEDDIPKPVPRSVRIRRPLKPVAKESHKFSNFEEEEEDDEKKMDKLLSHYSRKPTQSPSDSSTQNHAPKRSGSLPLESMVTPEGRKELSRAASYQLDSDLNAGHVHPKLPDYDDFVARLAAFRASSLLENLVYGFLDNSLNRV